MLTRVLLVIAAVLVLPASARAEGWLPGEFVGDDTVVRPALAVTPSGAPVAAYVTSGRKVAVVVRKPGGVYERTDVTPMVDANPDLAIVGVGGDAAGGVAVAYKRTTGSPPSGGTVYVASRPAGTASFVDRTLIGGAPLGSEDGPPAFAVLPDGTLFLARSSDSGLRIDQGPIGGSLTRTEVGPGICEERGPLALATNAAGEVVVALSTTRCDGDPPVPPDSRIPELNLLRRSASGQLSALRTRVDAADPASTSPPNSVTPLTTSVALGPDGAADVAWSYRTVTAASTTTTTLIRAAHLPAGATQTDTPAGSPRKLASVSSTSAAPRIISPPIAIRDAPGSGTIAYSVTAGSNGGADGTLNVASRPPAGASYAAPAALGLAPAPRSLLGGVPFGTGFELLLNETTKLTGVRRSAEGEYAPAEPIGDLAAGATLAGRASAFGARDGVVATLAANPAQLSLQVHDATPPALDLSGLPVPRAGVAATVPSGVRDAIDAAPAVRWDFGDGQSGTGAAPAHTWTAPGLYLVTATATDASGNVASAQRVLTVTPAPTPPGPGTVPVVRDTVAPKLGGAKLSPASVKRAKPTTTLTLSLSERATLAISVTQKRPGVKRGKGCKVTAKRVAKKQRCSATVTVLRTSAIRAASTKAVVKLTLKAKPAKGSYSVRVVATDAAGNRSAARTATLRVR